MTIQHVFIVGVAKCGTTALSEWMVVNGLAEDRVPGEKEPYLYANDEPHAARSRRGDVPLLDASAGYAFDPATVQRLPQYDTRLVLCLRNGFERMWSFYKMFKVDSLGGDQARDYFSSYQSEGSGTGRGPREASTFSDTVIRICQSYFPRRSHLIVEGYARRELDHLRTQTFMQRIEYELAFYLSRKQFPFFSILSNSFYYTPLRTLLERYLPSDLSVICVSRLDDTGARRRFVEAVFEKSVDTPPVPVVFSSTDIAIDEARPDFNDRAFDTLRACLRYDLVQARGLIATTHLGDSLLDHADLDRYLAAT
ncbi:hypothetical protein IFT68_20900 [Oxalobacteraceae sp. CFBP 13730]|nr:hypothetical protein [Oxalobacteraceae sp. CFBP 13730]